MAIFTYGAGVGQLGIDMLEPRILDPDLATSSVQTATTYKLIYDSDNSDEFAGTGFTYDNDGALTGGTITQWTYVEDGQTRWQITGLSLPATALGYSWTNMVIEMLLGNDTVNGTIGDDKLSGGESNDALNGNAGNDKLTGGTGNDTINGGAGIDTAIFSGNFANYSFALNNGDHILTSAAEGTDTLTDVEFARFADGVYDFATGGFTPQGNAAPTNIQLSKTALSEDTPIWTTVGLLSAKDADGEGHGRFERRPGAHRMFGDGAPIISLALKHQDELKLTPDQVANLEKTRTNYQNQVAPLHEQLRTVEGEIASLTQETPANLVQVKLKTQESAKLRSELRYLRIEALENGKSILTAEQRGQLDTLLAARRDEHRRQHKQAS